MSWLGRLFGSNAASESASGATRPVTFHHPLRLLDPRIGFLNLIGPSAAAVAERDRVALAPLFAFCETSEAKPPECEVLMIYAEIAINGRLGKHASGLRDIIRSSTASIVVLATENEPDNFIAALAPTGYGEANLVMTLDRKDPAFATFFAELFRLMHAGKSMPMAWVELAPQMPGMVHADCPDTIFSPEISHIVFVRK
ncbi:MAG: hypothetical protein ABIP49_02340 [Lysobacterales bacterium]